MKRNSLSPKNIASYPDHNRYLLCAKIVGREVGNKIEIIKNRSSNFDTISKEEFLQFKGEDNFIVKHNDIIYIIPKKYETIFAIRKLQGKL